MNTFWTQVDVNIDGLAGRFFMNDCGGRDQVVSAVNLGGWRGYEAPLPEVIAKLCKGWRPVFLDIGANTGFYSLLAVATGATRVFAYEPVPSIFEVFQKNVSESSMQAAIRLIDVGVGEHSGHFTLYMPDDAHGLNETSASLNKHVRGNHSASFEVTMTTLDAIGADNAVDLAGHQILMKIDVETLASQVIRGGNQFIKDYRPVIAVEILPDSDIAFFDRFCVDQDYQHIWLRPNQPFELSAPGIEASLQHRDHLLIPSEKAGAL